MFSTFRIDKALAVPGKTPNRRSGGLVAVRASVQSDRKATGDGRVCYRMRRASPAPPVAGATSEWRRDRSRRRRRPHKLPFSAAVGDRRARLWRPAHDARLTKADAESGATRRADDLTPAERVMWADAALASICLYANRNSVSPTLSGFVDDIIDEYRLRNRCVKGKAVPAGAAPDPKG